jgi:plastocyanin
MDERLKRLFWILSILITVVVIFFTFKDKSSEPYFGNNIIIGNKIHLVNVTSEFYPQKLEIKYGEAVEWFNNADVDVWVASDSHPDHLNYPGSGISKCGTSEQYKIFDSCKPLKKGQNYKFYFNEKGTWKYHNHLNPEMKGEIIVE